MYTLFISKSKNSHSPSPIFQIMEQFVTNTASNSKIGMIVMPGFLSTSPSTTQIFTRHFRNLGISAIGILNGMSSLSSLHVNVCNFPCPDKILFGNQFSKKTVKDHRKMVFIYEYNCGESICGCCCLIQKQDIDKFVKNLNILGVFIGSSNFSKTTYFGDANGRMDKGEADIFMFESDIFAKKLINNGVDGVNIEEGGYILSESIAGKNHQNSNDFFKEMLKEALNDQL